MDIGFLVRESALPNGEFVEVPDADIAVSLNNHNLFSDLFSGGLKPHDDPHRLVCRKV